MSTVYSIKSTLPRINDSSPRDSSQSFLKMFASRMRMNRPFRMISSKFSSKSDLNFTRIPIAFYENVWKKSNILYITYIVVGCVLIEVVYGSVTTAVWDGYNQGVCRRLLEPASISGLKNLSSGFYNVWNNIL